MAGLSKCSYRSVLCGGQQRDTGVQGITACLEEVITRPVLGREGDEGKNLLERNAYKADFGAERGRQGFVTESWAEAPTRSVFFSWQRRETGLDEGSSLLAGTSYKVFVVQGAEKVKAAQQEAEALKRETALAAAALEGRTQALARQEAAAAEAKALLAVRTKELDNREVEP